MNGGFFKAQKSGNAESVHMNKVTASAVGRSNICPNVWSKNILLHIK
jgi:hypothetical protein